MEAERPDQTRGHMILRDRFAENRTVLANERTFLAYIRTSLAFFAAGFTLISFFKHTVIIVVGWVLIPLGAYTIIRGIFSFRNVRKIIKEEEKMGAGRDS